jgi:hypothetical protein
MLSEKDPLDVAPLVAAATVAAKLRAPMLAKSGAATSSLMNDRRSLELR